MNRKLYLDICVILTAWILFLNGLEKAGSLLLISAAVLLLCGKAVDDLWRFLAVTLLSGILGHLFLSSGSISLFFPHAALFLCALSVHVGLLNEMVTEVSGKIVKPFFFGALLLMILFYGIAWILPEEWYTLFTKGNLYDLVSFIFLPIVFPMTLREVKIDVLPSLHHLLQYFYE